MSTRSVSSPRLRLLLTLGIAAAIPTLGAWAQDQEPTSPRDVPNTERDTPRPEPDRERTEREIDEARAKARQAREAELRSIAEKIREKREILDAEAARERAEAEERREAAMRERGALQDQLKENYADIMVLDLRIESTRDVLKDVWKQLAETELQHRLQGEAPAANRDVDSMNILRQQAETYERQLREYVSKKVVLAQQVKDIEQALDRARAQRDTIRGETTSRSVARSVDRLLDHLNEQGALDQRDHHRLNDAVGALEELIDIFRDYRRGSIEEPDRDPEQPEAR